ncbi:MAG: hypothetical protein ACE37M_10065 [Henriciella sp.]
MKHKAVLTSAVILMASAFAAPLASAACDISDTKCAVNGGKCNIKFKNRTSDTSGSDGSSNINQTSSAQTVVVKARKRDGSKAGNKLTIVAGASNTMNIDKKANKNFHDVQLASDAYGGVVYPATMSCEDVKAVLNGNGTCKVFHGQKTKGATVNYFLGYQCDGGNVGGPTEAHVR